MHGHERRREDGGPDHNQLHAGSNAIQGQNERRILELAESPLKWQGFNAGLMS
jgi:hypothetical protein